jgi:uncharacterized membrane protein YfcA
MNMQKLTKGGIVLVVSTIGSWIGAAMDHNNWFGVTSTVLGVIGIFIGLWLVRLLDDYINP